MKRVVVAIDGSEASKGVIDYAIHYANSEKESEMLFLHVIALPKYQAQFLDSGILPVPEEQGMEAVKEELQGAVGARMGDEELRKWERFEGADRAAAISLLEEQVKGRFEKFILDRTEKAGMGIPLFSLHIRHGRAYDQIVRFAEEKDADMIMIGHRGLSGVERFFIGSVAEKVVTHAPCSVYVHRPR